ncbi:MAG: SDR family oxidoreductase, partial [Betaproteobacteria bacterium]|nr:SDR family oxidoreductase [Betaproteobacteria bacterium]
FGKILAEVERLSPLRRNVAADEIAAAAVFLLSPLASAVTGEVLHADAGFHITAGLAGAE